MAKILISRVSAEPTVTEILQLAKRSVVADIWSS